MPLNLNLRSLQPFQIDMDSPEALQDRASLAQSFGQSIDHPQLQAMYLAQKMGLGAGDSRVQNAYSNYLRNAQSAGKNFAPEDNTEVDQSFVVGQGNRLDGTNSTEEFPQEKGSNGINVILGRQMLGGLQPNTIGTPAVDRPSKGSPAKCLTRI